MSLSLEDDGTTDSDVVCWNKDCLCEMCMCVVPTDLDTSPEEPVKHGRIPFVLNVTDVETIRRQGDLWRINFLDFPLRRGKRKAGVCP